MFLIVGLGNPGDQYKNTRHNVGFFILDDLTGENDWNKCTTCNVLYKKTDTSLLYSQTQQLIETLYLKPLTMMNLSGNAVVCRSNRHQISPKNIIIIHDDIDLAFGEWKISFGSGDGGHNGIKSVISALGTKDFVRIRIGIAPTTFLGKKKKPMNVEKFVLGNFPKKKIEKLKTLTPQIKEALEMIQKDGREIAMNRFN